MIQIKKTGQRACRLQRLVANHVHAARIQAEKFFEVSPKIKITLRKRRLTAQRIAELQYEIGCMAREKRINAALFALDVNHKYTVLKDFKAYR